jgi:peptidoglycan-associated lipoprotein
LHWHARINFIVLLLVTLALAGCPKPQPPPQVTDDRPEVEPPAVGIRAVAPGNTTEGTGVTVTITGHGFTEGSEVYLGSRRARGVDVFDDGELTFRADEDLRADTYDVRVVTPEGDQAVDTGGFRVKPRKTDAGDCQLETILFEFNEASLTSGARQLLSDNARCIESRGLSLVRLEGHADERGSTEYNLSLGQRRSESVRSYLLNLGVSSDSLRTVSYGEERPASSGFGESAWSRNRRVEFVVP